MRKSIQLQMPGALSEIARMAEALEQFLTENGVAEETVFQVNLCLDELITNAVNYGAPVGEPISVQVQVGLEPGAMIDLRLSYDGSAFDPLSVAAPDLEADIDSRRIGGLGVHFVRSFMDEVAYVRDGERNVVTLRKRLDKDAAPAA